jgi:hypothetical protein
MKHRQSKKAGGPCNMAKWKSVVFIDSTKSVYYLLILDLMKVTSLSLALVKIPLEPVLLATFYEDDVLAFLPGSLIIFFFFKL